MFLVHSKGLLLYDTINVFYHEFLDFHLIPRCFLWLTWCCRGGCLILNHCHSLSLQTLGSCCFGVGDFIVMCILFAADVLGLHTLPLDA